MKVNDRDDRQLGKDKEQPDADDLSKEYDGDRGMPAVNSKRGNKGKMVSFVIFTVVMLLLIGGLYFAFGKKKSAKTGDSAQGEIGQTLPMRTFDAPPAPLAPAGAKGAAAGQKDGKPIAVTATQGGPKGPDPEEEWRKSRFDGAGMVATGSGTASQTGTHAGMSQGGTSLNPSGPVASGSLGEFLQSTSTPMKHATRFKNRSLTIAKGTMIDCALKTRIVSTVPGMTACVVSRNIYSDDGKVVLIERGSELTGEYQSGLKQGQARLFVLWNRIKTPNGVIVTLDSPGTDPLGGSGIPGYVDSHWWTRFGNAILMTMIQDGFASLAQLSQKKDSNNSSVIYQNTSNGSQDMATETLKNSINIPPTLYVNQGDRINVFVARDLSFEGVYDISTVE